MTYLGAPVTVSRVTQWFSESRTDISGRSGSNETETYFITGSGLPPVLEHVSSMVFPSVDVGLIPGEICGGPGGVRTVRAKAWK